MLREKISTLIDYKLNMERDMTQVQYIIKSKNKTLLTEYINYTSKYKEQERVNISTIKLENEFLEKLIIIKEDII